MLVMLLLLSSAWGARCDMWEDAQRITHVRAADETQGTYCMGYLHGRDRAWQMDHFRRVALGRTAEVYGFSALKSDLMMRLLDLPSWGEKLWVKLGASEKAWLQAYARGVNHGFRVAKQQPGAESRRGYPAPGEWRPQDSLMVVMLQSFDQTRKAFSSEWEEDKTIAKWGKRAEELLNPDGLPWDATVLQRGEYPLSARPGTTTSVMSPALKLWAQFPEVFGKESGSNNWVVAPSRSKSGKALFANDPHLDLRTPMFWHWVHVETEGVDVIGATLPGVPAVVSGANRHVAWGLTNAYIDTADAVRVSEDAPTVSVRPLVWVKWGFLKWPFFFKSFEKTDNGYPVLPLEKSGEGTIVLKWSGFHLQGSDVANLRKVGQAKSSAELDATLAGIGIPSWNFVFADTKGVIGHRVVGRAFRHMGPQTFGLRPGTVEQIAAPDFLSPEEMPHVLNPKRGWIASANNRHWPMDSALHGGRGYSQGFRALRLQELLMETPKHDRENFTRIQCDDQAVDARFLAPQLSTVLVGADEAQKAWLAKLAAWDFSAGLDCEVCAVFRRTVDRASEALKIEEPGLWRLGEVKDPAWVKTVQDAFQEAWGEVGGKKWHEVHFNSFTHISNQDDWVFSPRIATRGDKHSVNPGSMKWNAEKQWFDHTAGASERLFVELGEVPEVWLGLPGLNARYDDHGEGHPWGEWESCRQTRVEWPVKWDAKTLERVEIEM
jgi:penicillin amidase